MKQRRLVCMCQDRGGGSLGYAWNKSNLVLSLSLSLSRILSPERRIVIVSVALLSSSPSVARRRRSRWWFSSTGTELSRRWLSSNRKVSVSCVLRFCMCLDFESYCSYRLFCVCYMLVRCIAGDGALSRWRRSLCSVSSIWCIGGDGALLDGDRALLDGDVGGVRRR